jgi:hypothetical protein
MTTIATAALDIVFIRMYTLFLVSDTGFPPVPRLCS